VTRRPIHIHQNEDEHFVILEGTARIASGDKTFDAAAGTSFILSKGIPHAWSNPSDSPLRMVVIASPGGCEEILRLIAKRADIDSIVALAEKFGVRNLGPMGIRQMAITKRSDSSSKYDGGVASNFGRNVK
jgi:oxalate decarboxylase/phosphoglucose isomerase-like protein (cupin superfamily)